ncbi:MAG: T9SS type A sorting domain-containing protein, partial [Bacteroidia bacterium]
RIAALIRVASFDSDDLAKFILDKYFAQEENGDERERIFGEVKRICLDQQNNVYSYGVFLNEPTFVSKGKNVSFKAKGSLDVFLQKFGSNGYEDFVYVFGSSGVDQGSSINWINGELLATGTYTGTIDFDPSNKKFNKTSSGTRSEAFVLSLKCNQNIESLGDSIADLKIECGVLNNYTPFLSDECGNAYTPENTINFPLKINADTVINWQYNLNGKTVIQSQKIVLADTTAPLISIDTLAPIYSYCELNKSDLSIPQAQDNCAGIIDAVTQMEFPMSVDTTIIWQFTDNYGNVSLQYQRVIITDTVKPVPMIEHLDTFFASCQFNTNMSIKAPEAYDSCAGIIKGVKQFEFGLNDFSIKKIIWTYTDNHGNSLTQIQPIKWQSINTKVENRDPELWVESALVSRQWLDCNNDYNIIEGANDRAYTPKTNGSYAVELTFQLCVDTSDCYQILNASVNNKNSTELTIYPNPASDILNIKLNSIEFEQGLNLDFFTPNGQNVKSLILNKQTIAKGAISINVAEFSKGLYFLKLSSSKGVVSKKIIVE